MANWWSFVDRIAMMRRCLALEVVIEAGEQVSDAAEIATYGVEGLSVPPLDSANLTFLVNTAEGEDGFRALKDKDGNTITMSVGAGNFALSSDDLTPLAAYRWVKLVISEIQSERRVFVWVLKT